MPANVDAGDGRGHKGRRDGAAAPTRRYRRHGGVAVGGRYRRNGRASGTRDSVMSAKRPKTSPAIEKLIDKGLFDRLPVSFSTYFYDQIQEWDLLFPAEKSYYERFFGLLDSFGPGELDRM